MSKPHCFAYGILLGGILMLVSFYVTDKKLYGWTTYVSDKYPDQVGHEIRAPFVGSSTCFASVDNIQEKILVICRN